MTNYGEETERKIREVIEACERYGDRSIIALSGVPGTGKSFMASIAAQRFTDEPTRVREIQFHQSFSYEEFVEGLRIDSVGAVVVKQGVFLEWNEQARQDPDRRYVLLIEELTRANLSAVLGELLTYLEHRDRPFFSMYSRQPIQVAKNLTIVATYNPTDRSAIDIDAALLRRLRIIKFPPSVVQLAEMLGGRLTPPVLTKLQGLFEACRKQDPESFEHMMPFGHGVFADVEAEQPDLNRLWIERIEHLLKRPLIDPHPYTTAIEENYPWLQAGYKVS